MTVIENNLCTEPKIQIFDNILAEPLQMKVANFLETIPWQFGGTSDQTGKSYPYWYVHFAGIFKDQGKVLDYSDDLGKFPVIADVWNCLKGKIFQDHTLVRCYPNAYPYGCEGTVHRDADDPRHYTAIFYPHAEWSLNWAGETMLFSLQQPPEVLATVVPRPNRLVVFQGIIPHVARGITRSCPVLRRTLMFKTTI